MHLDFYLNVQLLHITQAMKKCKITYEINRTNIIL